ncbi:MAG: DegT/DnrJ/EryC1/StrS family aminotransferase [Ginsengibacter sp.]
MPGYEIFGEEERKEINDVMDSGILMRYGFDGMRNGNWKSKELEQEICKTFGCKYAQLTSSGTGALTTAFASLGIGYGDEVIMPSFTFVASFEAVLSVGAIPVMVDIDDSLTLDPAAVRKAITSKTRCVMPVHMCGSMADMDELVKICTENKLILLEDACQSIGATYKGRAVGTIGHAGTFSFDFVKTITCGEGGVVMTNNEKVYTNCDGYTDHGHDHLGADRGADLHPFIGYNFRISELHSAIGLAQIKKLNHILSMQRKHHNILKNILSKSSHLTFRKIHDEAGNSCSFLSWFVPTQENAEAIVASLKEKNILAGNFYWYNNNWHYVKKWQHLTQNKFLNSQPEAVRNILQSYSDTHFENSDKIMSRCISTLINLNISEEALVQKANLILEIVEMHCEKNNI